ncbi:hypothetical protein PAMA_001605 [Pampus argenteus]
MMEMLQKQSSLVLLTVTVAVIVISAQESVLLDEKNPKKVHVHYGSSLTLYCNLTTNNIERFRVCWFFNPSGSSFNDTHKIKPGAVNISTRSSTEVSNETKQNLKHEELKYYNTSNATRSGWYFCKVTGEIPTFKVVKSQGVQVVIIPTNPNNQWWMWIVLGVSGLVLIVLVIACVSLRRRLCQHKEVVSPIYGNMRRTDKCQPSPRPGTPVDSLKTVSPSKRPRTPNPGPMYV